MKKVYAILDHHFDPRPTKLLLDIIDEVQPGGLFLESREYPGFSLQKIKTDM